MNQTIWIIILALILGGIGGYLIRGNPPEPKPITIQAHINMDSVKLNIIKPYIDTLKDKEQLIRVLSKQGIKVEQITDTLYRDVPTIVYSFDSTQAHIVPIQIHSDRDTVLFGETLVRMKGSFVSNPFNLFKDVSAQIAPFDFSYSTQGRDSIIHVKDGMGLWGESIAGLGGSTSLTTLIGFRSVGIGVQMSSEKKPTYVLSYRFTF